MPFGTSAPLWVALIAALGIGSIMAAVLGWFGSKAVAISNHRQNWINALRDDIVAYLKAVEIIHNKFSAMSGGHGRPGTTDDLEQVQAARHDALLMYRRTLLRLNMTERPHIDFAKALEDLLTVKTVTADSRKISDVITLAGQVLKQEWTVTKYGIFARPVMKVRTLWKRCIGRAALMLLVIVGVGVVGSGIWYCIMWYENRPSIQSSYYGVELGASKREAIYALGYPDYVRENPDNSPWKCCKEITKPLEYLNEPWKVDSVLAPLDKLPAGSKLDDYDEWNYNLEKGKWEPYIAVKFHNGNLETIKCYAGNPEGRLCRRDGRYGGNDRGRYQGPARKTRRRRIKRGRKEVELLSI